MVALDSIQQLMNDKIRPYAQMHGGDIEVVQLTKDNVLRVRLHGSCDGCGMATITLQYGVQQMLFEEFPDDDIALEVIQ